MIFEQCDVGVLPYLAGQGFLYRVAGGVGGMDDATFAMAAFACQMIAAVVVLAGEGHALPDQPFYRFPSVLDDEACHHRIAQPGTGSQRILDMCLDGVVIRQHGRDATLGPIAGTVVKRALGDQADFFMRRQLQRQRKAGEAAADNENVVA